VPEPSVFPCTEKPGLVNDPRSSGVRADEIGGCLERVESPDRVLLLCELGVELWERSAGATPATGLAAGPKIPPRAVDDPTRVATFLENSFSHAPRGECQHRSALP
jgi:hypothetical protein